MKQRPSELKSTTYEIFIGLLSVLAIINIVLYYVIPSEDVSMVIVIMDAILTLIFLADFLFRLFTAKSKSDYLFRQFGWADLLASLPVHQVKILRIFRVIRVWRLLGDFGVKGIFIEFLGNRARSTLLSLLLFVILLLEFGGMAILAVEQHAPNASINSGSDALWYIFVTITTVGYGDTFPVTQTGRLIALLIMAVGVGLFGTLTGFLSNFFIGAPSAETEAEQDAVAVAVAAPAAPEPGTIAQHDENAKAKLAELKQLLAQQQEAQAALARKIEEIETLL